MSKIIEWFKDLFCAAKKSSPMATPTKLPLAPYAPPSTTKAKPVVDPNNPPVEPDRPNKDARNQKFLRYPDSIVTHDEMRTHGKYENGYPEGAIVHFTSGRSTKGESDAANTVAGGVSDGYCFFVISSEGRIYQAFPLNEWGYHAGVSNLPGIGTSVSTKLVGIEVCCAGDVTAQPNGTYKAWFGETYTAEQVREIAVTTDNQKKGYYHKYTDAQEAALTHLLLWLKANNEAVFDLNKVYGHDEAAPTRKCDPGGSLSMSMPKFRTKLVELYSTNQLS